MSEGRETAAGRTLTDILTHWAERAPERIVYGHAVGMALETETITYAALLREVRGKAAWLLRQDMETGDRVVLLYPSSIDFISSYLACLMAGITAVPAYPPQRDVTALERICADCAPRLIVADADIAERMAARFDNPGAPVRVIPGDIEPDSAMGRPEPARIAMLQYTSGSTGHPKGVVVTHENLLSNLAAIEERFEVAEGSSGFSWLPMYHDLGLIGNVLIAAYTGSSLYFMAPAEIIQRPLLWLQAIDKFKVQYSGGPNFAYQLCVDRITPENLEGLDLSGWRVAFSGAEHVLSGTLDAFSQKFAECGFKRRAWLPAYGMAEASLLASGVRVGALPTVRYFDRDALQLGRIEPVSRAHPKAQSMVGCGPLVIGMEALVVDPVDLEPVKDGRAGEIWLRGPSITSGYWSGELDGARPTLVHPLGCENGEPWLRTGDIGFVRDDEIYVVGRIKDILIVRGRNYAPQDIEDAASASHEALSALGTVAFQVMHEGRERVAVLSEIKRSHLRGLDGEAAASAIRAAVARDYQIEVEIIGFVTPQRLPRTSSGKLQRSRARDLWLAGDFDFVHHSVTDGAVVSAADLPELAADEQPASALEGELRQVVAERLRVSPAIVSCNRPILDLGLDSLSQLELTHVLSERYGIEVSVEEYFDGVSIRAVADQVRTRARKGAGHADQLDVLRQ